MGSLRDIDWNTIKESDGTGRLEPGGYVVRIVHARDGRSRRKGTPCVSVEYDVAEGAYAGHYSDEWGKANAWAHTADVYYEGRARGIFKGFLNRLEESNPEFSITTWDSTPQSLDGLLVGALIRRYRYTSNLGEEKDGLEVAKWVSVQDIRDGRFEMPPERDERDSAKAAPGAASPSYDDENIPF